MDLDMFRPRAFCSIIYTKPWYALYMNFFRWGGWMATAEKKRTEKKLVNERIKKKESTLVFAFASIMDGCEMVVACAISMATTQQRAHIHSHTHTGCYIALYIGLCSLIFMSPSFSSIDFADIGGCAVVARQRRRRWHHSYRISNNNAPSHHFGYRLSLILAHIQRCQPCFIFEALKNRSYIS